MLAKTYNAATTESRWYDHWMQRNYFRSVPDEREPFTIVIPPPNVTGVLHMGHMLNGTVQDILIRRARLRGKNACWVPGTDHASIATEAKVVKRLREQGIKKSDLTREEFLAKAFEWKDEYGGIILEQLKKLGASCDWQRTRFTMEPAMSRAVVKAFVDLHRAGKIYRGLRMTNWDPQAQTVLSNEEVIYGEENRPLYHVRYQIEGSADEYITIATVRPETILGDSAIAVHPDDPRYAHLRGKRALVPMVNRSVPIIFDDYVDREFGTGALKITPAHDVNDYDIGQRHGLETIDVLNADGTMSTAARFFVGEDRAQARKSVAKYLQELGALVSTENYRTKVGRSERTDAVVEPRLTLQWFMDMKEHAADALRAVREKEVEFFPEHFFNMYRNWLREENVRDWCISRQLWWGQQIPAWFYGEDAFVAETEAEALEQARAKTGIATLTATDLRRDPDVVDTWFSSWLWPLSVFDAFDDPTEAKYYYPTSVLVTGWDIIFLWVARMVMAGYTWAPEVLGKDFTAKHGAMPFRDVYFTGMVRDAQRRKMSKSLGTSPDALALIDTYGADGVRFGLLSSAAAGNDIIFDAPFDKETKKALNTSKLCEQGRNFCNKMWNALRLVRGWEVAADTDAGVANRLAMRWIDEKFAQVLTENEQHFAAYRLSDALMNLYNFIWGDFCSWYLEMIKPAYEQPIDAETLDFTLGIFGRCMTTLHPFMPFVTEEIWHNLRPRATGEDCIVSRYPEAETFDAAIIATVERAKNLVSKIRDVRNANGVSMRDALPLYVAPGEGADRLFATDGIREMVEKMGNLSDLHQQSDEPDRAVSFLSDTEQYYLPIAQEVDVAAETARLNEEIARTEKWKTGIDKKLGNARFVDNAPPAVVEKERQKLADAEEKLRILREQLAALA